MHGWLVVSRTPAAMPVRGDKERDLYNDYMLLSCSAAIWWCSAAYYWLGYRRARLTEQAAGIQSGPDSVSHL